MEGKENITEKDLDFYLTVIALFCEYNPSEHYSDIMFKDITSDIIKRDYILHRQCQVLGCHERIPRRTERR